MASNHGTGRNHGWSPELLTLLGTMLAIGVGLAGLILNVQAQVREDIRELREDVRELRGDVVELRERVSHLEGHFDRDGIPTPRPEETAAPTSRS